MPDRRQVRTRVAIAEQLERFKHARSGHNGVGRGDCRYDVLHHALSELQCHALDVEFCCTLRGSVKHLHS